MARWKNVACNFVLVLGTAMVVVGGVVLFLVFPSTIDNRLFENLVLRNGTEQGDRFQRSPVPTYLSFYIFNVTNKDEVNENGTKAQLEELGPYVFREEKVKEVTTWNDNLGTAHYKERRSYHFEPTMTKGDLSDVVSHVNMVSVSLQGMLSQMKFLPDFIFNEIRGELVEEHTVDELIFSGFSMKQYFPKFLSRFCILLDKCTFAFYFGKNGTTGKEYEVSNGELTMKDYTEIKRYGGSPELNYWYGDTCNGLNGTDGVQFPPGIDKHYTPYVFSDDVCRSLKLQYDQEVTLESIDALRFVVPESVFADPNVDHDNMCFCQANASMPCPSKAGVVLLKTCQGGKPVMASAPHFYQGSPEYWEAYGGLNPKKELHQTFLDIEPMTGTVIRGAKRIQISIAIQPDKRVPCLKNVPKLTYFPAFWVEESGQVDTATANEFRQKVMTPYKTGKWSLVSVMILGSAILLIAVVLYVFKKVSSRGSRYSDLKEEVDESGAPSGECE